MALSSKTQSYTARNEIKDDSTRRALDDLASRIQLMGNQVNATPQGITPAPPSISALSVTAADGIFDVQIQDSNPVSRGIEYFLEYSTTASFAQPVVIHVGTTRNWRGMLGARTLFFRAYSQYPTSGPSPSVYFGSASNPTAVPGGGALAGPAPQASTGSGTASGNGLSGGQGYGTESKRNPRLVQPSILP